MRVLKRIDVVSGIIGINRNTINFKAHISGVEISDNKIFILLSSSSSSDSEYNKLNNVYCYDYNGILLWQIKSPIFKEFPKFIQEPIVGIFYDEKSDKFFANDWMGRRYEINQETGEPLSFIVVK